MKAKKKPPPHPLPGDAFPPGNSPGWRAPGKFRRAAKWVVGAALVLGAAGVGAWYGLAPAVPEVALEEGADPALVQAVSAARAAARRAPWSDGPRGRLGMLLHAHGLVSEAAACYAQAERLNPADPRWPYLHAGLVADDPPTALALLRRSAERALSQPRAPDGPVLHWADACLEQGLTEEAEEAYRRLLERWPDHPRARLGLARLALSRRPAEAVPHLETCTRHPATRKAARVLLAEAHRRRGDPEAAARAAAVGAGLPEDAGWPDPWLDEVRSLLVGRRARLGRLHELAAQGRLREAAALALKTTEEYPDVGWVSMGRLRRQEGKLAQAEAAVREGLRLNPSFAEGHFELGAVLLAARRYAEAAESFRRAVELEPADGAAYREWGRCALALGDKAEAVRRLRQAVQFAPQDAAAHRDLGELLAAEGRRQEAVGHLQDALRLKPDDRRARELLDRVEGGKP
jgi:tetratricopeptide (TPR) repeat protein